MTDVFPSTHATWLRESIAAGPDGRSRATQAVLARYREPLRIYLSGTTFGRSTRRDPLDGADGEDLVHGFLAHRVARPEFLEGWIHSGFTLRRWMINGFLFYLREQNRSARRRRAREGAASPSTGRVDDPLVRFERAWALAVIREASAATESTLAERGKRAHWELFVRHFVDDIPYGELTPPFGLTPSQAASVAREVAFLLRGNIRKVLAADGVPEEDVGPELALIEDLLRPDHGGGV